MDTEVTKRVLQVNPTSDWEWDLLPLGIHLLSLSSNSFGCVCRSLWCRRSLRVRCFHAGGEPTFSFTSFGLPCASLSPASDLACTWPAASAFTGSTASGSSPSKSGDDPIRAIVSLHVGRGEMLSQSCGAHYSQISQEWRPLQSNTKAATCCNALHSETKCIDGYNCPATFNQTPK